jgi:hypothetical protein
MFGMAQAGLSFRNTGSARESTSGFVIMFLCSTRAVGASFMERELCRPTS